MTPGLVRSHAPSPVGSDAAVPVAAAPQRRRALARVPGIRVVHDLATFAVAEIAGLGGGASVAHVGAMRIAADTVLGWAEAAAALRGIRTRIAVFFVDAVA